MYVRHLERVALNRFADGGGVTGMTFEQIASRLEAAGLVENRRHLSKHGLDYVGYDVTPPAANCSRSMHDKHLQRRKPADVIADGDTMRVWQHDPVAKFLGDEAPRAQVAQLLAAATKVVTAARSGGALHRAR